MSAKEDVLIFPAIFSCSGDLLALVSSFWGDLGGAATAAEKRWESNAMWVALHLWSLGSHLLFLDLYALNGSQYRASYC